MSEAATEAPATEAPVVPPEGAAPAEEAKTFDADYVAKIRAEAAKYRTEAKTASSELEKVRQSSMTETEKAAAEAEARGRAAATTEFGQRLATSRFDALASKRNPGFDTSAFLEIVDLKKFIDDSGEPDEKAIAAAVEKHVPVAEAGVPNFDGGTRVTTPAPAGMNGIIRKATGRA